MIVSYGFKPNQGDKAQGLGYEKEKAPTLNCASNCGGVLVIDTLVFDESQITSPINGNVPRWGGLCHTLSQNAGRTVVIIKYEEDNMSYQNIAGTLNPGAHPGSYNGQDAYNDMLVVDNGTSDGIRSSECRNYVGGVSNIECKS